jgi:hypothetical protein
MSYPSEQLPIRAGELTNCFYCENLLPATAKEHIFNSSWGGSHKTGNLICNECNSSFSQQTDEAFAFYTALTMNAGGFKGERHNTVPKIDLKNGYELDEGAILQPKKPIVKIQDLPNGISKFNLDFNSKSQAKIWVEGNGLANLLRRHPSAEDQEYFKKLIRETPLYTKGKEAEPQYTSIQVSPQLQYRSTAHTLLKCLGFFLPEWVQDDLTKPIREFARYDEGDWQIFAVETEQLFSIAEQGTRILELGVHQNSVKIYWNSKTKMVVGVLTILNRIKRSVVIAQNYSGPDSMLCVVEGTHGTKKPPNSIFIELERNHFSGPLLDVQYFCSPSKMRQFLHNELKGLMESYSIDAIKFHLNQGIETINKKKYKLDQENLEEYLDLYLNALQKAGKIAGTPVDINKARFKLFEYGFDNLANQHVGKVYTDSDVKSLMELAFDRTVQDYQSFVTVQEDVNGHTPPRN